MISIRPATLDDITTIAGFQVGLASETENLELNRETATKGIKALFDDPARGVYFVAESAGAIAGCFLITYEWSDWRNAMIWWLQSVYVSPPFRRKGVFRKMYDHILDTISQDDTIIGLRLYVDRSNTRAQGIYKSLGMNGDHYTVFEWIKDKTQ